MSAHDGQEPGWVDADSQLMAFGNRELDAAAEAELRAAAANDPELAAQVAEIEAAHGLFELERELIDGVIAPPLQPAEAAEPVLRQLERAAARAEEALRSRGAEPAVVPVAEPVAAPDRVVRSGISVAWAAAAALLIGLVGWVALKGPGAPELLGNRPGDSVLGGGVARIQLETTLRETRPELSWHVVVGASRYDVAVVDSNGEVLLRRAPDRSRSPRWLLTAEQFSALRTHPGPLGLRVVGYDGASVLVASSGDLPLRLVD